MDEVDREMMAAERQASNATGHHHPRYARHSDEIERVISASSASTSSTEAGAASRRPRGMSRVPTQNDLERHPTVLSRIATARSQHSATVGRSARSRDSRRALPEFGAGKPFPPPLPEQEEYVVEFDGPDDPLHAQNWPMRKKVLTAAMLGYTTMTSSFASSIFSAATSSVAKEYHVSMEVGVLGVSFFVLGFAFG